MKDNVRCKLLDVCKAFHMKILIYGNGGARKERDDEL